MSLLLRQLCAILVIVLLIHGSQGYYVGYPPADEEEAMAHADSWSEDGMDADKRGFFVLPMSQGKNTITNSLWYRSELKPKRNEGRFLRIGKSTEEISEPAVVEVSEADEDGVEKRFDSNIRIGKRTPSDTWIRIGKRPFSSNIRIGKRLAGETWIRLGKRAENPSVTWLRVGKRENQMNSLEDQDFYPFGYVRFGRGGQSFLRIGRQMPPPPPGPLRLGKRSPFGKSRPYIRLGRNIVNGNTDLQSGPLTPEQLQLIYENKDRLAKLVNEHPELINMSPEDLESYFVFPRQGRAMCRMKNTEKSGLVCKGPSFYFPRMGRSGAETETDEPKYCCPEGVRRIFTEGKGMFDICPRDQTCCNDMEERTKRYKDIVITECAVDDSLAQIRAFINSE